MRHKLLRLRVCLFTLHSAQQRFDQIRIDPIAIRHAAALDHLIVLRLGRQSLDVTARCRSAQRVDTEQRVLRILLGTLQMRIGQRLEAIVLATVGIWCRWCADESIGVRVIVAGKLKQAVVRFQGGANRVRE